MSKVETYRGQEQGFGSRDGQKVQKVQILPYRSGIPPLNAAYFL